MPNVQMEKLRHKVEASYTRSYSNVVLEPGTESVSSPQLPVQFFLNIRQRSGLVISQCPKLTCTWVQTLHSISMATLWLHLSPHPILPCPRDIMSNGYSAITHHALRSTSTGSISIWVGNRVPEAYILMKP